MRKVILLLVFLAGTSMAWGEDTGKFSFYYQSIEKVVQLEPETPPSTAWGQVKSFFRKGVNYVRKTYEKVVSRNLFPGEGTKLWFSEKDPKLAYQVKRVKVRDQRHLLRLMGAPDGDLNKLSNGQRALLAVYKSASEEQVHNLSKKAIYPRIVVHLSDTTGFEDSSKYPHLRKDFWPQSMGLSITMPSYRYSYPDSEKDGVGTFIHETAHSTNLTIPELSKPYGPDGSHYLGEMTKPRVSFQEGWSIYQEALFSPDQAKSVEKNSKIVKIEDPKQAGKYTTLPLSDPSVAGMDAFSCEAVNAYLFYRLAKELPNGEKLVWNAFFHKNFFWRNMTGFLKGFAKMYPEHSQKLAQIVDETTAGKLSNEELKKVLGDSQGISTYLTTRESSTAAAPRLREPVTSKPDTSPSPAFHERLQKALKKYMEAARSGNTKALEKARETIQRLREAPAR